MGRRRNNPDSRTFGSQDDTIRNSKTFRLTSGNSQKEEEQNLKYYAELLVSRTSNGMSEVL